jgi:pimeloyl-ACP methyl ester carboxylesterase
MTDRARRLHDDGVLTEAPLRSVWTRVDGLRVHARASAWATQRDAPTAVLVHGFVVASAYMLPTARRLHPRWRVFAPDLPGFGASDHPGSPCTVHGLAEALAEWMRLRRLRGVTLLGNSLGCQVVVELAVRFPELVGELVLVGPTVDPAARTVARQLGRLLRDVPLERPGLLPIHVRDWIRAGPRQILGALHAAVDDRIEQKLPLVRAPALVVVGERDPLVPRPWAEQATALLPRGRLVVVPGASHAVNYSAPEALVCATDAFAVKPVLTVA